MALTYFTNFDTIPYSNTVAIDLADRVIVTRNTIKNPNIYYPIEIVEGVRPDQLAYKAYGDPYASWVIYLNNDIIDPYYGWYLDQNEFNAFIVNKYGSVPTAQQKVKYYQNNWVDQPSVSVADFNAMTSNQMTYWQPNLNYNGNPINYSRKQTDWTSTTNYILNLGITGNGAIFTSDEVVQISYQTGSNGQAQVVSGGNDFLIVQHIFNDAFPNGNVAIGPSSYCFGTESGANVAVTSCKFVANNIPVDTYAYWAPVYYYDYENAINEGNKIIQMLQPQYVSAFTADVQNLLAS